MALPEAPEAATADRLRTALARNLRYTTVAGFGTDLLTQYPEGTAEAVMAYVTPVLEARDARIAELETTLGEILDKWGPEPYPGEETGFFRAHIAVSVQKLKEWHAVREGKSGSEEKGRPS